jgi:hypothetical protein
MQSKVVLCTESIEGNITQDITQESDSESLLLSEKYLQYEN